MILPFALLSLQALQTPPKPAKPKPAEAPVSAIPESAKAQMATQLSLQARAECMLGFKGRINRRTTVESQESKSKAKGKAKGPTAVFGQQDFDIQFPGELEEWQSPNGKIQYRFIPAANAKGATGHFKASEHKIYQLQDLGFTVEGDYVAGMSNWYINSDSRGGDLIPNVADITMRGKVLDSTTDTLKVGTPNVPVVITPLRFLPVRAGQATHAPVLHFQGLALWALKGAKAPFTVSADAVHEGKTGAEDVSGTTKITFALTPLPLTK